MLEPRKKKVKKKDKNKKPRAAATAADDAGVVATNTDCEGATTSYEKHRHHKEYVSSFGDIDS